MKSFEESEEIKEINEFYSSLKLQPVKIKQTQLPVLRSIMSNINFDRLCLAFTAIEDYFGCELKNADKTFVELKLTQIQSERRWDDNEQYKLSKGIERLQQIIFKLQQHNSIITQKFVWLSKEIDRYEDSLPDIQEEIQILQTQNLKFKSPKNNAKSGDKKQLNDLLGFYRCTDRPFPKNKTEALMLINRVQSMIQQLEMKKISNYMLQ